nr:acyl-CoA dehydrogenase family protein [uncultured Rhodopila sp.]
MMDGFADQAAVPAAVLAAIGEAAARHDRDGSFPHDSLAALHGAGLLALTVPARLGGAGASLRSAARVVGAVGGACASTALILAMQLAHQHRVAHGENLPPHVADAVGRAAVRDGALVNALRVEPALGTPARGGLPDTIARRAADGWRITGHKIYSTGSPGLTWGLVWARTDEATPRTGSFLVPLDAAGVRIAETWDHIGLRASGSHDVILDDVAVPADHAGELRPLEGWRAIDPVTLVWHTVLVGALYTGVARAARDWAVRFAHDRKPANLGASLATLPRVQEIIGRIEERLAVNDTLLNAAAGDGGAGQTAASLGLYKTTLAENAVRAVEEAASIGGNHALSRANPLERYWRDALCARVHTPQSDSAHSAAGRAALAI